MAEEKRITLVDPGGQEHTYSEQFIETLLEDVSKRMMSGISTKADQFVAELFLGWLYQDNRPWLKKSS